MCRSFEDAKRILRQYLLFTSYILPCYRGATIVTIRAFPEMHFLTGTARLVPYTEKRWRVKNRHKRWWICVAERKCEGKKLGKRKRETKGGRKKERKKERKRERERERRKKG